jgi:hypothetical protein
VRKVSEGQWRVEGHAWKQGAAEPTTWTLKQDETAEPTPGRASVWGSPYSGTPIRFDDLTVAAAQ